MLLKVHDFPAALTPSETWLMHAGMLGYLISAILAMLGLFWPRRFPLSATHVVAAFAALAFAVYFGLRFTDGGPAPISNIVEVMLLVALLLVGGYFVAMVFKPVAALSAWVLPLATIIVLMALPLGGAVGPGSVNDEKLSTRADPVMAAHILLAVAASAAFAFAFVVGVVYLLQDRALRNKRDSYVLRSLPPVETLGRMVSSSVWTGFPMLTISLALGFIAVRDDLARWMAAPIMASSLAMWVVFLLAALGRFVPALHGKRSVYLVVFGFCLVIITYVCTGFLPASHTLSATADSRVVFSK